MTRRVITLLAMLVLLLALVACGQQEGAPAEGETGDTAPETQEETPTEPAEGETGEAGEEATEATEETPAETPAEGESTNLGTAENPVVMSFVPSGDTQEIVASGDELASMITEQTGLEIQSNVATSYAAVVEAMGAGQAQVGWLNTFSYVLANERYGVDVGLATVRRGEPYYTGQVIAGADAGIESLEDIEGKSVCWVDELSTSGYIIPRIMIAAAGVDVEGLEQETVGSHPNVVTAVYNGDCDAGATYVDARTAIAEEFPDVNEKVVVVRESPKIPNDTVSFAPDVPDDIRQQIVDALLEIAETEEGQNALHTLYEIEGFQEVDDSFYDEFRTELDASGIDIETLAR